MVTQNAIIKRESVLALQELQLETWDEEPKVFEPDDDNVSMQVKSNLSERVIFQSLLYNLQKLELF